MNEEQFLLIKDILKKYNETKYLYNFLEKTDDTKFLYYFFRDVEISYYSLKADERFFFYNEFIAKNKKNWWRKYYSPSQYLSLSYKGCESFLRKFHEIH